MDYHFLVYYYYYCCYYCMTPHVAHIAGIRVFVIPRGCRMILLRFRRASRCRTETHDASVGWTVGAYGVWRHF